VPTGRDEARREVGHWRQDEQPLARLAVRDLEEPGRLRRVQLGVDGSGGRRSIDRQPRPTEDEEIEVELARPPALALTSPERALDRLEGNEEGRGTGRRVGAGRHVECGDRVPELRLVDDADGPRRVEP